MRGAARLGQEWHRLKKIEAARPGLSGTINGAILAVGIFIVQALVSDAALLPLAVASVVVGGIYGIFVAYLGRKRKHDEHLPPQTDG